MTLYGQNVYETDSSCDDRSVVQISLKSLCDPKLNPLAIRQELFQTSKSCISRYFNRLREGAAIVTRGIRDSFLSFLHDIL